MSILNAINSLNIAESEKKKITMDVKKNPPANAEDAGSIPGSRRSPGEGNGNPLQYSCLGNHMDRGALQDTVHAVTKNQT